MRIKLKGNKSPLTARLILTMLDVLSSAGIPTDDTDRRLERMAMATLAVGGIDTSLKQAVSADDNHFLTTRQVIEYINAHYGEQISPGSYDDIRRRDLRLQVTAGLVLNSSNMSAQATNNPKRGYALSPLFAALVRSHNTSHWSHQLKAFKEAVPSLKAELRRTKEIQRLPVTLPSGITLQLTGGEHNALQKAIIEEFLPRFGRGAQILYVGDTADKFLYVDKPMLDRIGFFKISHEELPDVVAYSENRNTVLLIEAVHSAGPINELRKKSLTAALKDCSAELSFITCFASRKEFRKWANDIAWETEVWIVDTPDHMIHFNGDRYLAASAKEY